ncbi:cardiolipin synthase [Sphingobium sp. SYK-6]|uniref:phospholipase D-like domain-containing protein n=1 Tax=Sphingobium sp. (strain NBRC 103272 / SYK-6) TaxID=627192 RepID=UPI0002277478|nr:phospholipase D-like domain-containing protein [Sphingobium sp. SYK-6]BAK67111.1 cardiolipin synthase [Sphingobium sp. SYK-6]
MDPMVSDLERAWYALEWIIRIGALAIVPLRRTPAAARAWLLLIFFLPLPGLLLFLAIGSPRFPAWRRERFAALTPFLARIAERLRTHAPAPGASAPVAALAETLGHMPATGGNLVELIDDYDGVIDRLIADIDGARRSVHLLVYIFADDAVGRRIADALGRAVLRGLDVRVLFDPVGSLAWRRGTQKMLRTRGVRVCETLPLRLLRARTRRDMRNHRKLFVIDGEIGYAGSQNIVARDFRPGVVNRELVARVRGPVVASMDAIVRADWSLESGEPAAAPEDLPAPAGDAIVQLLPSGADYPLAGFETLLVWQLHEARERAIIVTPYFIPDESVLNAMISAVARGVRVDLIVSGVIDQRLVHLSQSSFYDELLVAGIHIHLFNRYLLHAKNVSIDRQLAIVGSSNVDLRSFQLNQEASLLFHDAESITAVAEIQQDYLDNSTPLKLEVWRSRSRLRRPAENIARMMNSLL